MTGSRESCMVIPFGPFEADLLAQELRKLGVRIRLPRQSFQILKMLLERPGELVTRDELRAALWPSDTFVDFEHGLNAAINRLREALCDDADNPRYVETLPRRGYRFVGPTTQPSGSQVSVTGREKETREPSPKTIRRKLSAAALGAVGLCVLVAVGSYWLRSPLPPPRVLNYRQLTKDRQLKGQDPCYWYNLDAGVATRVVTDGPRIFFSEPGSPVVAVSSSGGDAVRVSTPFKCFRIFDISPDRTELLGSAKVGGFENDQPLWVLSIATGQAHRLGSLSGRGGGWSPDGERIAYATGNMLSDEVYIAPKDGSDTRKLLQFEKGYVHSIRWSPDGKVLRMTVSGKFWRVAELWEVSVDGSNPHRVEPFPEGNHSLFYMNWTPDHRYSIFTEWNGGKAPAGVWALREKQSAFRARTTKLTQLTTGTMSFWNSVPSVDGKQIFAIGGQFRGELVRYDLKSRKLEPYLSGISAEQLDFSRDGNWVTYVTFPEGDLWRSKVDGSQRMQLTSNLYAGLPRWSPDGNRIAFAAFTPRELWKVYVVPASGGKPEVVSQSRRDSLDPTWSPDGNSLIFGELEYVPQPRIFSVDLQASRVSVVPASERMCSPRLSPDGRFIVALEASGYRKLFLFEQQNKRWSELLSVADGSLGWPQWSGDGKFVYVQDLADLHAPVFYRIRVSGHKVERVATIQVPESLAGTLGDWMAVAPDGSPIMMRDLSIEEIYAFDVDLP